MIEFYEKNHPNNLLLYNGCAKDFIKCLECKVKYIGIHFSDPGLRKKHAKRRLINLNFFNLIANVLKPEGETVQIVTDSYIYQEHIQEVIVQQKFFEIVSNFFIGVCSFNLP